MSSSCKVQMESEVGARCGDPPQHPQLACAIQPPLRPLDPPCTQVLSPAPVASTPKKVSSTQSRRLDPKKS